MQGVRVALPQDGNGEEILMNLGDRRDRFLEDLIRTIRERTGVKLSVSDVFRSLVDSAMELDFSEVDFDLAYGRAQALSALLATRQTIEREIRQTESDLHQALVLCPQEQDAVKNFRRNLRYQSSRMDSLMEQVKQCRQLENGDGNGAEQVLRMLLSRHLEPDY